MSISTVTSKGQTTIPKEIREYLHIKAYDKLSFIPYGKEKVVLSPIKGTILDLKGALRHRVKGKIDFKALREKIKSKVAHQANQEIK
jgi:AbrB family looped-hinge helix DNA binding protein